MSSVTNPSVDSCNLALPAIQSRWEVFCDKSPWSPPSEEDLSRAFRTLSLQFLQHVFGYDEGKHDRLEARLIAAHKFLLSSPKI
jgi:hypothetical protein